MEGRHTVLAKPLDLIAVENSLAITMLAEIAANGKIKSTLDEISTALVSTVLEPIIHAVSDEGIDSLTQAPSLIQELVTILAKRYFAAEKPFGAVSPEFATPEDITSSVGNIKRFLNIIKKILNSAIDISSIDEAHTFLGSMAYLNWFYCDYLDYLHSNEFTNLKDMLWPTPEELDVRITRVDLGEAPQLAISAGIGTVFGKDLALESQKIGVVAGKSLWGGLSMEKRFELLTKRFDAALEKYKEFKDKMSELKIQISNADQEKSFVLIDKEKLKKQLEEFKNELKAFKKKEYQPLLLKMQYYKMPLLKNMREPLSTYAKSSETTFQKLVKIEKEKSLPLLSSVSGSTARALIAYTDIGCFSKTDGRFDLDKAQIAANCLMAFYIHAGHHSFSETAEIYNRLLDFIAIEHPEQLPLNVISNSPTTSYMDSVDIVERKIPYYAIGDYRSFFHYSYAEDVTRKCYTGSITKCI